MSSYTHKTAGVFRGAVVDPAEPDQTWTLLVSSIGFDYRAEGGGATFYLHQPGDEDTLYVVRLARENQLAYAELHAARTGDTLVLTGTSRIGPIGVVHISLATATIQKG